MDRQPRKEGRFISHDRDSLQNNKYSLYILSLHVLGSQYVSVPCSQTLAITFSALLVVNKAIYVQHGPCVCSVYPC